MSAAVYIAVFERLLQVDSTKHIQLCCLCLNWSGEDVLSINDEVVISIQPGKPVRRKISLLLKFILDARFCEVVHILKSVCKQCLMSAIASYKFIYLCKMNTRILYQTVESIETSLADLPNDDTLNCNTLYIAINPADVSEKPVVTRFYDKKRLFVPQDTALMRFRTIYENIHPTSHWCINLDISMKDILLDTDKPYEYKCKLCEKSHNSYASLREHFFRIHHQNHDEKCKECYNCKTPFNFLDREKLAIVSRNETNSQNKKVILPHSSSDQDLDSQNKSDDVPYHFLINEDTDIPAAELEVSLNDNHKKLLQHTGDDNERVFVCEKCNATFTNLNKYIKHRLKRKGCTNANRKRKRRDYYCDYCSCHYRMKHLLEKHIMFKHMGEETMSFICDLCGKGFAHANYLKLHRLTHTGEKNFICPTCGEGFLLKKTLKNHMTRHSEARNYPCSYCDKAYKTYNNLSCHIQYVHKPRSYQCNTCHQMFHTKKCLKRHTDRHYNPNSRLFIYQLQTEDN